MTRAADAASPASPAELLALAEQAARLGGAIARSAFGSRPSVRLKRDRSEVTEVDETAEREILRFLRAARPDDGFVSEEDAEDRAHKPPDSRDERVSRSGIWWVIDPIDGTRNFVRGAPLFGCTVAAMRAGEPIAGVVYDPVRDLMYAAAAGGPLRVNGAVSQLAPLSGGKPVVGIPSVRDDVVMPVVVRWVREAVVRNVGSSSLHMAMVASGQLDAALLVKCKLWDIAAGWLLVRSAGGHVTRLDGGPRFPLDPSAYAGDELPCLASRAELYERLISEVRDGLSALKGIEPQRHRGTEKKN
jgi:myo-inositol-1(or 4)-monophosphatase